MLKNKIVYFLFNTVYVIVLMLLSLIIFWHAFAKDYIYDYIDDEYGIYIERQTGDIETLKECFKNIINDKDSS